MHSACFTSPLSDRAQFGALVRTEQERAGRLGTMHLQREDEAETPTPPSAPVPPLQMRPPLHPQQPAVVSNLAMDQVLALLSAAEDPFFECEGLRLQAKRALACTCSTLRPVIYQLLRQPRLVVQESDAIWDNARFLANVLVPNQCARSIPVHRRGNLRA